MLEGQTFLFQRISEKINSTSSAFRNDSCQVGRLPKHYWKHSKTNKRLLRVRCCEGGNSPVHDWRLWKALKNEYDVQQQETCLLFWVKPYFDKISSKVDSAHDWRQLHWGLSGSQKEKKTWNKMLPIFLFHCEDPSVPADREDILCMHITKRQQCNFHTLFSTVICNINPFQ